MRKLNLLLLTVLFCSYIGYGQADSILLFENYLPKLSKSEIQSAFDSMLKLKDIENLPINPHDFTELTDLTSDHLDHLIPIYFIRIEPDSISKKIHNNFMSDLIYLWHPSGVYWTWTFDKKPSPLHEQGSKERMNKFLVPLNNNMPINEIYAFYFLDYERFAIPYIGFTNEQYFLILDQDGISYNTIDDVIIRRFGTYDEFVKNYYGQRRFNIKNSIE